MNILIRFTVFLQSLLKTNITNGVCITSTRGMREPSNDFVH